MKRATQQDLAPYVARLAELPFVEDLQLEPADPRQGDKGWDARLRIRAGGKEHRFYIEHKRIARLNYGLVDALLMSALREPTAKWILFAPHITSPMATYLQKRGVNYVDALGNCHLVIDKAHVAIIDGRRPARSIEETRTLSHTGYKVLFTLLARPQIIHANIREIARVAGVGKTVVATALQRLEQEGLIARTRTTTLIVKPTDLLHRWLAGYFDILRPRLLIGYYRTPDNNPIDLEARIAEELHPDKEPRATRLTAAGIERGELTRWAWGGAAAAYRLTGHYRGETTVLHIDHPPTDLLRRLRIVPARTGPLVLLRAPGPLGYEGIIPNTAHPLLVYAELLATGDDRAREAAPEIHERFLRLPE